MGRFIPLMKGILYSLSALCFGIGAYLGKLHLLYLFVVVFLGLGIYYIVTFFKR